MIDTYHSSLASPPPPLPPRHSQMFMKAQVAFAGHIILLRSVLALVMLHFLLTAGGFAFLFYTETKEKLPGSDAQTAFQQSSSRAFARMIVARMAHSSVQQSTSGFLQWNMKHSVRHHVNTYGSSWLTVLEPGDYMVFSRVTFSRAQPERPTASAVKLKRGPSAEETVAMRAYCSLDSSGSGQCTASVGEVMSLERGNQLSLWVQDLSLVDYSETATSFGIYKL
ncbi:CD40 ligand [Corythoichthys intestinalis]|uniref:CD40 ligand n=1 Tax=Corythoichthys intestinalis TaxID=161448 RepID=UPI0025A648B2|nr:CD40 ligand [Corythoichthys intestinalis]